MLDLPDSFAAGDPDRLVHHCAALLFVVRPEWMRWLRQAKAAVGKDRPDLRARLHLFGALAVAGQGRLDLFDHHRARADALDPNVADDPFSEVITAWSARLATLHDDHATAVAAATDVYRRDRQLIRDSRHEASLRPPCMQRVSRPGPTWRQTPLPRGGPSENRTISGWPTRWLWGPKWRSSRATSTKPRSSPAARSASPSYPAAPAQRPGRDRLGLGVPGHGPGRRGTGPAAFLTDDDAGFDAAPALLALFDEAMRQDPIPHRTRQTSPVEPLTERELTILGLLTSHLTFPEIGRELFISRHTVKTHVSRIYRKLGASSRSTAVRSARELGIM